MPQIIGHFDGVEGTRASGWIADTEAPDQVLAVSFFRVDPIGHAIELGRVRANRRRDDLCSVGLENVNHGFEWRVPFLPPAFTLSARLADTDWELPDSPVEVVTEEIYEGHFDGVDRGVLLGWATAWDPTAEIGIEIFVDGHKEATIPADRERRDLVVAQIGSGCHGFFWVVPRRFTDGRPHEYACRVAETSTWLDGSDRPFVVLPGEREFSTTTLDLMRGFAHRPDATWTMPKQRIGLLRGFFSPAERWGRPLPVPSDSELDDEALAAARGEFRRPLVTPDAPGAPTVRTGRQPVRLLVAVWGDEYIAVFCRTCLPSFLSKNNIPYLAAAHDFTFVVLTRRRDYPAFAKYPAFRRLSDEFTVTLLDIDDVLARWFDPAPSSFNVALTYAYLHGMRAVGSAVTRTNFLFWNADFLPAEGVFRTVSELISAGVRATIAPSLRVDMAIEDEVLAGRRSDDGAVLDIDSREWVRLAMRYPHPTVKAQTVNRYEERMIVPVSQLYWHLNDEQMVARQFFMFMLHLRPERMWDEFYGFCDYTFLPEMVPSSAYHFEVDSDRILILELQHQNRDIQNIALADEPMSPAEVASALAPWVTREHMWQSRQRGVFNARDTKIDEYHMRALTDPFMAVVYDRLPKVPLWHNGLFYWRQNLAALGEAYRPPERDHPRSHLAAALRWTGYDIDALRESWPGPAGPPASLFDIALPCPSDFDPAGWLAAAHAWYFRTWCNTDPEQLGNPLEIDLASSHFHGLGWGLVERRGRQWVRPLGPDGRGVLLLRVPEGRTARITAFAAQKHSEGLVVYVNGLPATELYEGVGAGQPVLRLDIDPDAVEQTDGRIQLLFTAPSAGRLAFLGIDFQIH